MLIQLSTCTGVHVLRVVDRELSLCMHAGPAINHFQQVEAKGAIFWVPLVFAIGLAEAYRVGLGWEYPKSANFFQLRDDYEVRALSQLTV